MNAEKNGSGFADPMTDVQLANYMGVDAQKWAQQWVLRAKRLPLGSIIDEGWMLAWFANAIEAGRDQGVMQEKGHRPGDQVSTHDIVTESFRRRIRQRLVNLREMGGDIQPRVRDALILEELWELLGLNQLAPTAQATNDTENDFPEDDL